MFKKLRQKIENVDPASTEGPSTVLGGKRTDDNRRPSRSAISNLKKTDSTSSLNSCDDMVGLLGRMLYSHLLSSF